MNNLEQIVAQYYTDINGNPMSYHIVRNFTISPNNYQIQLDGIYDKHKGVEVIEPEGLFRVYNHDEIAPNRYFVRADGNVFFDASMASKTVKVDYYSIGLPCIGAGRIYTLLDDKGNVIETLQDILKAGQLVVDSLKTMGDVKIVIDEIQTSKNQALKCRENLDEGIDDANKLYSKLNSVDYVQKNQFVQTVDRIDNDLDNTDKKIDTEVATINTELGKKVNKTDLDNELSSINVTINGISEKVKKSVTEEEFTEFKQNSKQFEWKVEQKLNLHNILPNSTFDGGMRGWLCDVPFWSGISTTYDLCGRMCGAFQNTLQYDADKNEKYLQTHKAYRVKKHTNYTINFHYVVEKNVHSMDAFVVLSDTEKGDYAQSICILTAPGGSQSQTYDDKPFSYKFNTGDHEYVWIRFDHNGMKENVNTSQFNWVYLSEIAIYEGDVGQVKWIPAGGETYSTDFKMDQQGFKAIFSDGSYASMGHDGFEWYNSDTGHSYHALAYVTAFGIPAGNPGKVEIKLPKEFTKREASLKWTVALRGYYYSTSGNFFPMQVHVTGAGHHIDENGLIVCPVQGYCKIQNAENMEDKQDRDVTAMLIAIA